MKLRFFLLFTVISLTFGCSSNNTAIENPSGERELYFPPIGSDVWETLSISDLNWNTTAEQPLYDFLNDKDTKAFIILKDGKIVVEKYFDDFSQNDSWYWASAGKTLSAFMVGIAQEEGYLHLNDTSADYLGENWSSLTNEQESNIKIWHHITMTSGLNYTNPILTNCTLPNCLTYLNVPGSFWYYHNAAYTLTQVIIEGAIDSDFTTYFNSKLKNKIGMNGIWIENGFNNIYWSTARSMARFGLLNLNKGIWDSTPILNDINYFNEMTTTSQTMNKAYGYLWWLNGKDNYRSPGLTSEFQGKLISNAPNDLIAGLGKNDQKLYIVPSQNLVIVRMGEDAGEALLGPSSFDNDLWEKLNDLMN